MQNAQCSIFRNTIRLALAKEDLKHDVLIKTSSLSLSSVDDVTSASWMHAELPTLKKNI